jgi:16S rRNA (cytosine967-C5)-methyltransferase
MGSPAEERLRAVPWDALRGLAAELEGPIAAILAGEPAERVLDRALRARRGATAPARCAIAEALFGVALWRRRLRAALGDPQAPPRLLLAALLRDLARVEDAHAIAGLAPGALPPPRPPPSALADRASLPDPVVFRANALLASRDEVRARLAAEGVATCPGALAPHALRATSPRPNVLGLAAHRAGLVEVQDEASQLVGALLGARPGEAVLDACAGAGGKTLLLAAEVGPRGRVHAADPDGERLARLRVRAARAGAGGIVELHGAAPRDDLAVDRAFVDAPCSELGALRRGPDARWRIDPSAFARLPALQGAILAGAARRVRPGGRLVYATCTFRREEDEDVALAFERAHPGFERLVPPEAPPVTLTAEGFVRTWPHRDGADAFFAAAWEKR